MTRCIAAVVAILMMTPALAHHSYAMFDQNKTVTIEGTVTQFQWTAPHSWIDVAVTDKAGVVVNWSIETGPPSHLSRRGWKKTSLVPGDKVVVQLHPLRAAGKNGGALISVKRTSTGQVLLDNGPQQRHDAQ